MIIGSIRSLALYMFAVSWVFDMVKTTSLLYGSDSHTQTLFALDNLAIYLSNTL